MRTIKNVLSVGALAAFVLALSSCGNEEKRLNKGFRLPDGDEKSGELAFVELKCHRCHSVSGVDLPKPEHELGVQFALGGEVRKVKSYGELVTAIIQPQHTIAEDFKSSLPKEEQDGTISPMLNHNRIMTVQQLTDLVTFLHAHYEREIPEYDDYPYGTP